MIRLIIFLMLQISFDSYAKDVAIEQDRITLNWSTMKIHFYGEAEIAETDGEAGWKNAENYAWKEGVKYIYESLPDLIVRYAMDENTENANEIAKNRANEVSRATYSRNTHYFGDGKVRVSLETPLSKFYALDKIKFKNEEPSEAKPVNSSLEIRLNADRKPAAAYRILNKEKQVLFEARDVAKQAFEKNLMGRWFKDEKSIEVATWRGEEPVSIAAKVQGDDFVVNEKDWDRVTEGNEALLESAKISIILP